MFIAGSAARRVAARTSPTVDAESLSRRDPEETPSPDQIPVVLFVCIHNAGRSQAAAALLDHHARGRVRVISAGSEPAVAVNPAVAAVLAERGLDISERVPARLREEMARSADVVVTMGCGDTCPIYPGKQYADWAVPDPAGLSIAEVRPIVDDIDAHVRGLLETLTEQD